MIAQNPFEGHEAEKEEPAAAAKKEEEPEATAKKKREAEALKQKLEARFLFALIVDFLCFCCHQLKH